MKEGKSAFKILTGKRTGKTLLERHRRRWEDNIRMYFKAIDINTRNWVHPAHDRYFWRALVNPPSNLRVP